MAEVEYKTFEEFYPFYLSQHANATCRRLHVIGSTLAIIQLIRFLLLSFTLTQFLLVFVIGYGFAWIGHFVFEKNKPATFKYPLFSFQGDMRLIYEVYTGKMKFWRSKDFHECYSSAHWFFTFLYQLFSTKISLYFLKGINF